MCYFAQSKYMLFVVPCKIIETRRFVCMCVCFVISTCCFLCSCRMCFCFSQTNCIMNEISFSWSANCARSLSLFLFFIHPQHLIAFTFFSSFLLAFFLSCRSAYIRVGVWHGMTATFKQWIDTCLHRIRPVISISMPFFRKYYVNKIVVCIWNEAVIKMTGFMERKKKKRMLIHRSLTSIQLNGYYYAFFFFNLNNENT